MNRKYTTFLLSILLLIPLLSYSQNWRLNRYEASLGLGTANIFGDIGGTFDDKNAAGLKDIQLQYTRPSLAFGARYFLNERMTVKMNLIYGIFAGNDLKSRNDRREFAFTATIFEPSFQFEYYLISEAKKRSSMALFNRRGMINNYRNVYLYFFSGVGGAFFNSTPKNDFIPLYKDDFSKFGIVFPVGFGLKVPLYSQWSLGFEFGRRFTTTDFIDGYTSAFSSHNDTYYFGILNAVYKIRSNRRGWPTFRNSVFR